MVLSVVIPVYNEADTLEELISLVLKVSMEGVEKEVIIVDDGSTDNSRETIRQFEKKHSNIRALYQKKNQGKGAALQRGFKEATGDIVIIQDADLEYDPEEYPLLINPIISGRADVVFGSRFITTKSHRVLFYWHSLGNRFLTLISNLLTDLNLTDMETCYKAFRRDVLQRISLREKRFGVEPEITAKLARLRPRLKIYEVGISYFGRTYEEGKKIGWRDGLRALWCIIRYRFPL